MSSATFKIIKDRIEADASAVVITLFEVEKGGRLGRAVCGWISGSIGDGAPEELFLPLSAHTLASIAVLRGLEIARTLNAVAYVVDPDDLWSRAWNVR